MSEDHELLDRFVREGSEAAFSELVHRRIALVYAVALRQTGGDCHRAEDVTQQVFIDLARKAPLLRQRPVLLGWLYRSTQYASRQVLRGEARRRQREQEAQLMDELAPPELPTPDWDRLRPALDQVLDLLGERDRDAVLLRFFDGRSFGEIGERLNLSENAARMRVERALDKLHALLARRGITSTGAALSLALTTQAVAVTPAGFAATVSSTALAAGAATGAGSALATSVAFMSALKTQLALTAGLLAVGGTGYVLQTREHETLQQELGTWAATSAALPVLRSENEHLQAVRSEAERLRSIDDEYRRLRVQIEAVQRQQAAAAQRAAALAGDRAGPLPPGPVYDVRQLDVIPKPTSQFPPTYPVELRQTAVTGEAIIGFLVDDTGQVHAVEPVRATHPAFAAAAKAAVERWRFAPGQRAGVPVNTRLHVPIKFAISDPADPNVGPGRSNWF